MKDVMTPQEVAAELGVSLAKVYRVLSPGGDLPAVRIGRVRILRADLNAWIARHRSAPASESPKRSVARLSVSDLPGASRYLS